MVGAQPAGKMWAAEHALEDGKTVQLNKAAEAASNGLGREHKCYFQQRIPY